MKLTITGNALETLVELKETLPKKMEDVALDICDIGLRTLNSRYATAEQGVSTYIEPIPNGHAVVAEGEKLGFVEFGAGTTTSPNEFSYEVPFEVSDGSWSRQHNGMYAQRGYWYYNKKRYTHIMPTWGMHYALQDMRAEIERLSK